MFAVDQETANTADIAHVQVDLVLAVTLMVLQWVMSVISNYIVEFIWWLKDLWKLHMIWHLKENLLNTQKGTKTE